MTQEDTIVSDIRTKQHREVIVGNHALKIVEYMGGVFDTKLGQRERFKIVTEEVREGYRCNARCVGHAGSIETAFFYLADVYALLQAHKN